MALDEAKLQRFHEWLRTKGVTLEHAELRYCGAGVGFGVFALRSIRHDETVLEVPEELMIVPGMVADLPEYADILSKCRLDAIEVLTLFFYNERLKGSQSEWCPYLDVLPTQFGTPLCTRHDLLLGPDLKAVRKRCDAQRKKVEESFVKIKRAREAQTDWKLFVWAWHVVTTRCITVDAEQHELLDQCKTSCEVSVAVIPVVDMLNHNPDAQCTAGYDASSRKFRIAAENQPVATGTQVFICYGLHDNVHLWLEYGFRLERNPFNRVDIPFDLLIDVAKRGGIAVDESCESALSDAVRPSSTFSDCSDDTMHSSLTIYASTDSVLPPEMYEYCALIVASTAAILPEATSEMDLLADHYGAEQTGRRILQVLLEDIRRRAQRSMECLRWMSEDQENIVARIIR
ncbi:SET domain containing protein [Aphelenchoides avenae]|nr:SET domain containing protein [Aphelenchus avenae]